MSIDKSLIIPEPWVTPIVAEFIKSTLTKIPNPKILEFGAGCSTAFFTKYSPAHLVSLEHSHNWYNFMQEYISKNGLTVDLRLIPNNYYEECDKFADNYFDFIMIDGKHRISCLEASRRILKPGGVVLLDDSDMSEKYKAADQIMLGWPKTEASGLKGNPLDPDEAIEEVAATWWTKPFSEVK